MALCLSSGSGIAIAKSQPESKADSDAESDAEGQYREGKDMDAVFTVLTFIDTSDIRQTVTVCACEELRKSLCKLC